MRLLRARHMTLPMLALTNLLYFVAALGALRTALRLGVSPEAARAEFRKRSQARPAPAREAGAEEEKSETERVRPVAAEFWLLRLLLRDEEPRYLPTMLLPPFAAAWLDFLFGLAPPKSSMSKL